MKIEVKNFWVQKEGNFLREYEDAFAFSLKQKEVIVAVADGASDTSFSRKWAKILVRKFKQNPESWLDPKKLQDSFARAQKAWIANIDFSEFDYSVETKIREGACSTILGIKIYSSESENENSFKWKAMAVGDSCLFHIRNDKIIKKFPLEQSGQFTHCLPLLCSVNESLFKKPEVNFLVETEPCKQGEMFLLCTDALAKYILTDYEEKRGLWRELLAFESRKDWTNFIHQLRQENELDNDDTTMVIIRLKQWVNL